MIVDEAGGRVTDLDGGAQRYDRPLNGALISNGVCHDALLELVSRYRLPPPTYDCSSYRGSPAG